MTKHQRLVERLHAGEDVFPICSDGDTKIDRLINLLDDIATFLKQQHRTESILRDVLRESDPAFTENCEAMKSYRTRESLIARIEGNPVCPACGPTDAPCEHVPTSIDFI